jgi:hypothetical protein
MWYNCKLFEKKTKGNKPLCFLAGRNLQFLFLDRDYALPRELTPNLRPLRAAFRKSDQISKQNTLATHFYTYNLPRN